MSTPKTKPTDETQLRSGVGASDGNSGGGAGTPDAETGARAEDAFKKGDTADDRKKLFPHSTGESNKAGRTDVSNEETE